MNIALIDYTKISPKGRAAGKRVTVYAVNTEDLDLALEKARRTHTRRQATGGLAPAKRPGGWAREYANEIDYRIL
jgi:hypothetical protein